MDVPKMRLVRKRPLAASAVVAPVVADTREIDPLGVTKLVTHKVEVPLPPQGHGEHADHLVQRNAAVDNQVGGSQVGHAIVHLLVHQPEGNGLVTNERLVVALAVAHHLLLVPAVGEGVNNVAHLPLIIRHLLEKLDPHVRRRHSKPVVETKPSLGDRARQGGHARHILGDREAPRAERVDKVIGKHEVHTRVHVCRGAEVVVVAVHEGVVHAVMLVQDRSHSVEAEAVELVLLKPPTKVGEEEPEHLPRRVVVNARVPQRVVTLGALVKVVVRGAVKIVDAILDILGRVRVHHIEQHVHSEPVALVHKPLARVRVTRPRRGREQRSHVVPKRGVIRVLLDSHKLDGVVPEAMDAGEDKLAEQIVGVDAGLTLGRHADVGLVDTQALGLLGKRALEDKLLGGVPEDSVVPRVRGSPLGRLNRVGDPGRDAGGLLPGRRGDGDLVASLVGDN
mmetsp:Transcript_39718/g.77744  ORF Transcript_39718/g.77744 Transcript_39718/m.77744 type:complete len:451 (-) Transcript_39718:756-2108(-)